MLPLQTRHLYYNDTYIVSYQQAYCRVLCVTTHNKRLMNIAKKTTGFRSELCYFKPFVVSEIRKLTTRECSRGKTLVASDCATFESLDLGSPFLLADTYSEFSGQVCIGSSGAGQGHRRKKRFCVSCWRVVWLRLKGNLVYLFVCGRPLHVLTSNWTRDMQPANTPMLLLINHTRLHPVSIHQMARTSGPIGRSSLLIYRLRKDKRLSWRLA